MRGFRGVFNSVFDSVFDVFVCYVLGSSFGPGSASLGGMDSDVAIVLAYPHETRCFCEGTGGITSRVYLENLNKLWKKHSVFLMRCSALFCGEIETSPNVVCTAHSEIVRSQG